MGIASARQKTDSNEKAITERHRRKGYQSRLNAAVHPWQLRCRSFFGEGDMITTATYEHPVNGAYNETVAILSDGRKAWINTQYGSVSVDHAPDCAKSKQDSCWPIAACTCGAEDNIDKDALVADARVNGKTGYAPRKVEPVAPVIESAMDRAICPKCGTVCYGDCGK